MNTLDDREILHHALEAGFTLKEQPDGSLSLHPYVWRFAKAIEERAIANAAAPEPITVVFIGADPLYKVEL